MEEHLARCYADTDFFFTWQVSPSVIFGRNQVIEQEVNLGYCRQHDINVYRRKSGGGCVYADRSNVMLSMVMSGQQVGLGYNRFITLLLLALRRMGLNVAATGRNDLVAAPQGHDAATEGRKVSGTAFYQLPGRSIIHSTLLYDTCMQHMVASITPDDQKLVAKGIRSVRQRIALLKDLTPLPLTDIVQQLRQTLCTGTFTPGPEDMAQAERLEREYLSPSFIYGRHSSPTLTRRRHLPGVGTVEAHITMQGDTIGHVRLLGDFFLTGDLNLLTQPLSGLPLQHDALMQALPADASTVVRGLSTSALADLLCG